MPTSKSKHREYLQLLRRIVFPRDGGKCRVPWCGSKHNLHGHHILYRSSGGEDAEGNLVTVCVNCHRKIHDGHINVIGREAGAVEFKKTIAPEKASRRERTRTQRLARKMRRESVLLQRFLPPPRPPGFEHPILINVHEEFWPQGTVRGLSNKPRPAKAIRPCPMTKSQVIGYLAETTDVGNKRIELLLESLVALAAEECRTNGEFDVPGVGRIVVVKSCIADHAGVVDEGIARNSPDIQMKFDVAQKFQDSILPLVNLQIL